MYFVVMARSLLLLLALASSCAPAHPVLEYAITTQSHYLCCRTLRYATLDFPETFPSSLVGDGIVVRLTSRSSIASCGSDLRLQVLIANNGEADLYIPVSHELDGDTLRLYPFRGGWINDQPVRIARQLQYGDIVDRETPRLRFHRLPAGREVRLEGLVPVKWLCSRTIPANDEYLAFESRNTDFFVGRSKSLGTLPYSRDPDLRDTLRLRFDVAYARLDFYHDFPIIERRLNPEGDSVSIHVATDDQPKSLLDDSQGLASSNVVTLPLR